MIENDDLLRLHIEALRVLARTNQPNRVVLTMLFSPTIGAAVRAGYWFLWVRCPACQTINAIDLRAVDRHPDAAVSSLIRRCRAGHADRMHHSPNWCGSREQASPTKCG
jgi:phage FluMu protein Com